MTSRKVEQSGSMQRLFSELLNALQSAVKLRGSRE